MNLEKIDVKKLPELQGWKEKMEAVVKDFPFVEISDNESYQDAKKARTALKTARTSVQNQEKLIASKLSDIRKGVKAVSEELINITADAEKKQQEEVTRYEARKEAERAEKAEKERQRVLKIREKIDEFEGEVNKMSDSMTFETIDSIVNGAEHFLAECKSDFNFEEFEELFIEAGSRAMKSLNEKIVVLKEKEAQRLENERLKKEAEENARIAREAQEKLEAERKEMQRQIEEREKEEAERQAQIEADKQKIAQEKEEIRKKEESENKMAARVKRLTDDLGLKFDFQDSFVGEDGMNVSIVEIKTLTDDEFDAVVQKCLDFKNRPEIEEKSSDEDEIEYVDFEEPWESEIDSIIDRAFSKVNKEGLGFLNSEMLRCKNEIKELFKKIIG